ncbi:MAG TPA: hypothetical protein VKF42_08590 [Chitinivibrionales bacterium]|jgi:hypothetical protein|nr:hypothetical protein [Chitinivibrionales bacterium]
MHDSKAILSFPGCKSCLSKPCERLRFGYVFPGKLLFVHKRHIGATPQECPFLPASFDEVQGLIDRESLVDLVGAVEDIVSQLSAEEYLSVRQEDYVTEYGDVDGRLHFLEALWDAGALAAVRVPENIRTNRPLAAWLQSVESPGR